MAPRKCDPNRHMRVDDFKVGARIVVTDEIQSCLPCGHEQTVFGHFGNPAICCTCSGGTLKIYLSDLPRCHDDNTRLWGMTLVAPAQLSKWKQKKATEAAEKAKDEARLRASSPVKLKSEAQG